MAAKENDIKKKNGKPKKAIRPLLHPVILTAVLTVLCIVLICLVQKFVSYMDFLLSSKSYLENVTESLDERSENIRELESYRNIINEMLVVNLSGMYNGYDLKNIESEEYGEMIADFRSMSEDSDVREMYIVDEKGEILVSSDESYIGKNLIETRMLDAESFKKLLEIAKNNGYLNLDGDNISYLDIPPVLAGGIKFYCGAVAGSGRSKDNYLIAGCSTEMEDTFETVLKDLSSYFGTIDKSNGTVSFAADSGGVIIYAGDDEFRVSGKNIAALSLTAAVPGGKKKTVVSKISNPDAYTVASFYSSPELGELNLFTLFSQKNGRQARRLFVVAVAVAVSCAGLLYAGFNRKDAEGGYLRGKVICVMIAGILAVGIFVSYIFTMYSISDAMRKTDFNAQLFRNNSMKSTELLKEAREYYENCRISITRSVAGFVANIEGEAFAGVSDDTARIYTETGEDGRRAVITDSYGNPLRSACGSELLEKECIISETSEIFITNPDGKTIMTNGRNWYYDASANEDLVSVLSQKEDSCYFEEDGTAYSAVRFPLYTKSEEGRTVYCSREEYKASEDGSVRFETGLLVMRGKAPDGDFLSPEVGIRSALKGLTAAESCEFMIMGKGEEDSFYTTIPGISPQDLTAETVAEDPYKDNAYHFVTVGRDRYFCGCSSVPAIDGTLVGENYVLLTLISVGKLYESGMVMIIAIVLVTIFLLSAGSVIILRSWKKAGSNAEVTSDNIGRIVERIRKNDDKEQSRVLPAAFLFFVAALFIYLKLIFAGEDGVAFQYVLSRQWEKEPGLFSVTYVAFLIVLVSIVLYTARRFIRVMAPSMSSTAETVSRLVLSVIQYAGILVLIIYSLQLFGFKTGTVVTFGGIITGVIGLGSQSLISDIIAGLFIIMEREYKVNDIVTVDKFTGVVQEIGLRTTKIQDYNGNVKTINNSKISGVLNLTDNYTTDFINVSISNDTPVDLIEDLINGKLRQQMKDVADIIAGPWFSGIVELKAGMYIISVGFRCVQQKQWSVKKETYRHLMKLLNEEGIRFS